MRANLDWSPSASHGHTPTQIEKDGLATNGTAPPSHCHYATLCQLCSVKRSRRFIEALSWICGPIQSLTLTHSPFCMAHTLFIRILPVNFHVGRLWALVQFNLGTFVRFLRFLLALPLDQTGSPIYYILWYTLYLCNIPPHHLSLPFPPSCNRSWGRTPMRHIGLVDVDTEIAEPHRSYLFPLWPLLRRPSFSHILFCTIVQ